MPASTDLMSADLDDKTVVAVAEDGTVYADEHRPRGAPTSTTRPWSRWVRTAP
jgi:hypothetical protein